MTRPLRLSKSRFMSGRQCVLRLWNDCFHRDLATPADAETQARFDVGNEVGELARQRYPGVLVEADHFHPEEALAETAHLLADPTVKTIQEAAFEHRGGFARVDILTRRNAAWDVIEVKSVLDVEEKHWMDAAFQGWVVGGAGLSVGSVSVMVLNRDYRYAGGDLDLPGLFRVVDITPEAAELVPTIEADLIRFQKLLESVLKKWGLTSRDGAQRAGNARKRIQGCSEPGPNKRKKLPEVGEDLPHVVAYGAEDGILGISKHAIQPVPPQLAVCFLVADLWLDC